MVDEVKAEYENIVDTLNSDRQQTSPYLSMEPLPYHRHQQRSDSSLIHNIATRGGGSRMSDENQQVLDLLMSLGT